MPVIFDSNHKQKQTPDKSQSHNSHPTHKPVVPEKTMKPLAAYAVRPNNVRFETQEEAETVELFLRQHPIVNAGWIILSIILFMVPVAVFPLLGFWLPLPFELPLGYVIIGTAFWYLASVGFVIVNFIHWFFNIYIVTNERIVDIDFIFLLYKHISVAELDKVQDLSYVTGGLMATIFDYGTVRIQTAGEVPNIEFAAVPHPQKVVERIRDLTEELQKGSNV